MCALNNAILFMRDVTMIPNAILVFCKTERDASSHLNRRNLYERSCLLLLAGEHKNYIQIFVDSRKPVKVAPAIIP